MAVGCARLASASEWYLLTNAREGSMFLYDLVIGAIEDHSIAVILTGEFYKEIWELTLNRMGLHRFKTEELYQRWMHGQIGKTVLSLMLLPEQVDEFILYHERQKRILELIAGTPDGRRFWSRAMQLENIIAQGLEENVLRARKRVNVVRRAN